MPLPHMSMVRGEKNVEYLRKRYETMSNNPLFKGMEFSDNPEKLKEWIPLIIEDSPPANEAIAATKIDTGTDVNFGALTRILFDHLKAKDVDINYNHSVESIKRTKDGLWELKVHDKDGCKMEYHTAKFVFLGAGGGSLELLQKSGIPEGKRIWWIPN
ncbi:putative malate:quinone oxidoreductase OS=Lysinibacillus sphaericus OX=1421 GN=mqo1 PE=3 SV=1 [Lysinibacillus sphaericus]